MDHAESAENTNRLHVTDNRDGFCAQPVGPSMRVPPEDILFVLQRLSLLAMGPMVIDDYFRNKQKRLARRVGYAVS